VVRPTAWPDPKHRRPCIVVDVHLDPFRWRVADQSQGQWTQQLPDL
jgi:hypothetical protein